MANMKRKYCQKRSRPEPKPEPKQVLCGLWVKNVLRGEDYSLLSFLSQNTPQFVRRSRLSGKRADVDGVVCCRVVQWSGVEWSAF